jgi:O-antigen/teichoic acid export membrane protein
MLRGSGIYSITLIGQRLGSLVTTPIVTRALVPAEYGILDLLDQTIALVSLLLGGNFSYATGYFFFESDSPERRRKVIGTSALGALLLGIAAALICWPWSGHLSRAVFHSEQAAPYLRLMFVSLPLSFALEALMAWLRVEDLPGAYVIASLTRVAMGMCGVIFLVGFLRLRVYGMLYGSLASAAVPLVWLAGLCIRRVRPGVSGALFLRMARFAAPLGIGGVMLFGLNFADRFFLTRYATMTEVGVYGLAYKIGMLISAMYASFHTYWSSQVYAIMKREDSQVVFSRLCTYVALGLSACLVGLIACARPVLHLLAPPAYAEAAGLIPLILAAYAVRSMGDFFRCLFAARGRPAYDTICLMVACAFCVGLYFLLIPRYRGWGAAVATLAAFVLVLCMVMAWTHRLWRYRLEKVRLLKIGIALAAALAVQIAGPRGGFFTQIGWAALVGLLFPALLWLMRFVTPGELELAKTAVRRLASRWNLISAE